MRRWPALALAAAVVASCGGTDVRTESAAAPSTAAAPTTAAPAPPTTGPPPSTAAPPTTPAPGEPSTSAGDELFPELGSADLDVQSYDVTLRYDPATRAIDGSVELVAAVARELEAIALDAGELTVESVTVDGAPAAFEHVAPELLITPASPVGPAAPVTVRVDYADEAGSGGSGFDLGVGWTATESGSYVLNEPDGARSWLPSNDHPSDKATWRVTLTVPTGAAAVANGQLVEQRPGTDGDTWVWEQDEPMATYLLQVLTGEYEVLDGGRAGATPLTNVVQRGDAARMQPYFDLTDDQIAFFEPYFGPFPLDQYGLAFTESQPGLAMETQGRSMFSSRDFPGGTPDFSAHLLLAHELAHQWFGDAVSPAAWSDLWLNESFASYGEWMWLDHVGLLDLETEAERNLRLRQFPTEPTAEPSVANLFGLERYSGGAVVLHALRAEVGDDVFFELLRRWVADNDGTSRSTEDFTALAEEISGEDLDAFFADWLYAGRAAGGVPGLTPGPRSGRESCHLLGRFPPRWRSGEIPAQIGGRGQSDRNRPSSRDHAAARAGASRPAPVSAASARSAARRTRLTPSQRSGSTSQRRGRWPTASSDDRSDRWPVISSASTRPARWAVATPSPT